MYQMVSALSLPTFNPFAFAILLRYERGILFRISRLASFDRVMTIFHTPAFSALFRRRILTTMFKEITASSGVVPRP